MEINIKGIEDLNKLEGWKIENIVIIRDKPPFFFRLRLSHMAAERPINLDFSPVVSMNITGNRVTAIPDVRFAVNDAEEK